VADHERCPECKADDYCGCVEDRILASYCAAVELLAQMKAEPRLTVRLLNGDVVRVRGASAPGDVEVNDGSRDTVRRVLAEGGTDLDVVLAERGSGDAAPSDVEVGRAWNGFLLRDPIVLDAGRGFELWLVPARRAGVIRSGKPTGPALGKVPSPWDEWTVVLAPNPSPEVKTSWLESAADLLARWTRRLWWLFNGIPTSGREGLRRLLRELKGNNADIAAELNRVTWALARGQEPGTSTTAAWQVRWYVRSASSNAPPSAARR
jgi:hypothetical protein